MKIETCGIPNINTSKNAVAYGYTRLDGQAGSKESKYGLTVGSGQWAAQFYGIGVVWGMANLNNTKGTYAVAGTPDTSVSGSYCWCQVTGFKAQPSGSYGSTYFSTGPECTTTTSSKWVYLNTFGISNCAQYCGNYAYGQANFRAAMYGVVGQ